MYGEIMFDENRAIIFESRQELIDTLVNRILHGSRFELRLILSRPFKVMSDDELMNRYRIESGCEAIIREK